MLMLPLLCHYDIRRFDYAAAAFRYARRMSAFECATLRQNAAAMMLPAAMLYASDIAAFAMLMLRLLLDCRFSTPALDDALP